MWESEAAKKTLKCEQIWSSIRVSSSQPSDFIRNIDRVCCWWDNCEYWVFGNKEVCERVECSDTLRTLLDCWPETRIFWWESKVIRNRKILIRIKSDQKQEYSDQNKKWSEWVQRRICLFVWSCQQLLRAWGNSQVISLN